MTNTKVVTFIFHILWITDMFRTQPCMDKSLILNTINRRMEVLNELPLDEMETYIRKMFGKYPEVKELGKTLIEKDLNTFNDIIEHISHL